MRRACDRCRRGQTGNCESVDFLSTYGLPLGPDNGGFVSELTRVPYAEAMLLAVPDGVEPARIASLSDNIPDAWRTVGPQLDAEPGAAVLICAGAGSIARLRRGDRRSPRAPNGSTSPAGVRTSARWRRASAPTCSTRSSRSGSGPTRSRSPRSPDHAGLNCALRSTEPDGVCTAIAIYFEPETPMPLLEMYTRGIRFHTGRCHARATMEPILELIRDGSFEPELVTHETATWDEALEAVAGHEGKLVITREG